MARRKTASVAAWIILSLFAAGLAAGWYWWPRPQPISADAVRRPILAVLVFENSNHTADLDFLANSLTHDTIAKIGQLCSGTADLIGHDSVLPYRNTRKTLHQVGAELGVDYILQGSVLRDGDKLHLTAQFTRNSDQVELWDFNEDRTIGDLSGFQNEIIQKIADSLHVQIKPADLDAINRSTTENSAAREAYLHAVENCEDSSENHLKECIGLLQKALAADPKYPRAHVALADAELRLKNDYVTAEREVREGLTATDAIPEAHYVLGDIFYKFRKDDKAADQEFRKAVDLNRSESEARLRYVAFLLQANRVDEAQTEITRALQLDPFRLAVNIMDGRVLIAAKSYDRAIERLGNTVGLDRSSPEIRYYLGQAYLSRAMYDDAIREFEKAVSFGPKVVEYQNALATAREAARRAQAH